jgi:hypothetical protein
MLLSVNPSLVTVTALLLRLHSSCSAQVTYISVRGVSAQQARVSETCDSKFCLCIVGLLYRSESLVWRCSVMSKRLLIHSE